MKYPKIKIYLDTCVVSSIVKEKWPLQNDSETFKKISTHPAVYLVVSQKNKDEICNIKDEELKKKVMEKFEEMEQISPRPSLSCGGLVRFGHSSTTQDVKRTKLRKFFYKKGNKRGKVFKMTQTISMKHRNQIVIFF